MHKLKLPTLTDTFHSYLATKRLKPKSVKVYTQVFQTYLIPFHSLTLNNIAPHAVLNHHKTLPPYAGNLAMRLLRALYNFANMPPPTVAMTKNKTWNKEKRRKTHLAGESLKSFFKGANALENSEVRDYLLFLLFTGLRRSEASNLTWSDVNLEASEMTIRNPKNGESVVLPMNSYAREIIASKERTDASVFHTSASTQCLARVGVRFCPHDLRRTFATAGDELDMSPGLIKQLLNHKTDDVTEGYLCRSSEKLRRASQTIGDFLIRHQETPTG